MNKVHFLTIYISGIKVSDRFGSILIGFSGKILKPSPTCKEKKRMLGLDLNRTDLGPILLEIRFKPFFFITLLNGMLKVIFIQRIKADHDNSLVCPAADRSLLMEYGYHNEVGIESR